MKSKKEYLGVKIAPTGLRTLKKVEVEEHFGMADRASIPEESLGRSVEIDIAPV